MEVLQTAAALMIRAMVLSAERAGRLARMIREVVARYPQPRLERGLHSGGALGLLADLGAGRH